MIGKLKNFLALTLVIGFSQQALCIEELYLKCSSAQNSTSLVITIQAPNLNSDCDPAYDDSCLRTLGSYSLTSDLSSPDTITQSQKGQRRYTGTFNEFEENGLTISSEGRFEIEFNKNFRSEIQSGKKQTQIKIESFQSVSEIFELTCQKDKYPY